MANCDSCGGVIGRDCFNPSECAYIDHQQQMERERQQGEEVMHLQQQAQSQEDSMQEVYNRLYALERKVARLEHERRQCE